MWNRMAGGSIHHINKALNQRADDLSKEGLQEVSGLWSLQVVDGGNLFSIQDFAPPDFQITFGHYDLFGISIWPFYLSVLLSYDTVSQFLFVAAGFIFYGSSMSF